MQSYKMGSSSIARIAYPLSRHLLVPHIGLCSLEGGGNTSNFSNEGLRKEEEEEEEEDLGNLFYFRNKTYAGNF